MKKTVFILVCFCVSLAFFSCKRDVNYIYNIVGEEISYPEKIENSSIEAAIKKIKGWTNSESSMDIVITGAVDQTLLLRLKERISQLELNVKNEQIKNTDYSFVLNCDFSGMTGVTSFQGLYFNGCKILGSIKMPECFTAIPKETFTNCSNLKSLEISSF